MPKVELTEELKEDLRVLKFRKHIFPKRFYKQADSDKLPSYFQIGTIVDDGGVQARKERMTKKEQKGSIAQQFLRDDQETGFSKRKYENRNDRLRNMGNRKKQINDSKGKREKKAGFKKKAEKAEKRKARR